MDGNTTVITRASDMAVARGIVVCNSAGNNGENNLHNTLNAPADGDSVLAIGAVTGDGTKAGFSSIGPTTSIPPRIKPDVMALGASVYCASPTDPAGYIYEGGTSLACPLAAGVVALLIHASPDSGPIAIANALRQTASRATAPDNRYGWGIVNASAAIEFLTGVRGSSTVPSSYKLFQNYPNPFNPSTRIRYDVSAPAYVTVKIYDLLGREIRTLVDEQKTAFSHHIDWLGQNKSGDLVASGVYLCRLTAIESSGKIFTETRKLLFTK